MILALSLAAALAVAPDAGDADAGVPSDAGPVIAADAGRAASPDAGPAEEIPADAAPRPSEEDMFGAPETPAGAAPAKVFGVEVGGKDGSAPASATDRSQELLNAKLPYEATDLAPENPLTIGGLLYLRSQLSASQNQPPSQYLLSAPFLLDTYLDARPNDRVRAFFLLRTEFDPTYNPNQPSQYGFALPATPNPELLIDQMWIKFDIARKVFVTAGRQHVKWGTAHFWFPNDLLNPVKLQPLAVFDQRTGVTMLKANLPLPDQNLNLYGMGLFEGLQQANTLGQLGGALRAEYVLSSVEAGIDMVSTLGQHNRYGGDVSFGIWDFDLYAEGALTDGRDNPLWRETYGAELCLPGPSQDFNPYCYQQYDPQGYQGQVAAGLNYAVRYGNNRTITFGGEYFYNGLGYTTPSIYPYLLAQEVQNPASNALTFFYLGQQYAGLYVLAPAPGSWYNSTLNFSTVANLSDQTFLSRIDFFQQVLTHLRVEAFVDCHYGGDGELHFSLNLPAYTLLGQSVPALNVSSPVFDVGLALRVSL